VGCRGKKKTWRESEKETVTMQNIVKCISFSGGGRSSSKGSGSGSSRSSHSSNQS
jgi:hypothetical protein